MKREEVVHVARAAAQVAGVRRVLVIGSQALLGSLPDVADDALPADAVRSIEADLVIIDDPVGDLDRHIDAAIGEGSRFHQTHGYYADGVDMTTAKFPQG